MVKFDGADQRGLTNLSKTRLSSCRMIQLYAHTPPSPHLPSEKCISFSVFHIVSGPAYWGGGGRGRAWSRIIRPQESLGLCKLFNPIWNWWTSTYSSPWTILLFSMNCVQLDQSAWFKSATNCRVKSSSQWLVQEHCYYVHNVANQLGYCWAQSETLQALRGIISIDIIGHPLSMCKYYWRCLVYRYRVQVYER